jgi:hypothetical protein
MTSYQGESDTILPVGETVTHAALTENDHVAVDLKYTDSDDDSGNKTVNDIVQEAIAYYKVESITDHVKILIYLQSVIVYGRPLEVQNVEESVEGETNYILVNRNNLLITSFDEISGIYDLRSTAMCHITYYLFVNSINNL